MTEWVEVESPDMLDLRNAASMKCLGRICAWHINLAGHLGDATLPSLGEATLPPPCHLHVLIDP